MTPGETIKNQARRDRDAWRTTGPRVEVDGVAYRLKAGGWIFEATGRYVVRSGDDLPIAAGLHYLLERQEASR